MLIHKVISHSLKGILSSQQQPLPSVSTFKMILQKCRKVQLLPLTLYVCFCPHSVTRNSKGLICTWDSKHLYTLLQRAYSWHQHLISTHWIKKKNSSLNVATCFSYLLESFCHDTLSGPYTFCACAYYNCRRYVIKAAMTEDTPVVKH